VNINKYMIPLAELAGPGKQARRFKGQVRLNPEKKMNGYGNR
jgi:hypothetical protein